MQTKLFLSLVCAACMTSMALSADGELSDYQARTYVRNETNRLMSNRTNDPSVSTLKREIQHYVLESYKHGWFLLGYFYFEKELYNGILYELTRYIEEESYYLAVDKLRNHTDKYRVARKISRNIRGEFDTITSQMGRQGKKLLSGHVSPFIGQRLHEKVAIRLKEQGFLNQSGQKMAQDNYEKREYKDECAICLEKYSYSRQLKTLHCGHSFCHECLLNQYKAEGGKKLKCAACYQHVNTEDYPEIFHANLSDRGAPPAYSVYPDPGAGHYARCAPPAYGSDY